MDKLIVTALDLDSDTDITVNKHFDLGLGQCHLYSQQAPYKIDQPTANNEDRYLVARVGDDSLLLAIADGAGGHAAGDKASALAIKSLVDAICDKDVDPHNLRDSILNGIERCNQSLLTQGQGAATTLVVVEIQGSVIRPYHVGDSSILVTGQRGVYKLQTIAHSPVGFGIEAGLLATDAALHHDERHWVSNLVGTPEMRIEVGAPLELARFDTLLLCSDGLTDNMAPDSIVDIIRKGPLNRASDDLVSRCHQGMAGESGHADDLTVLLYRQSGKA